LSYVEDLLDAYRRFVSLPWQQNLAPAQRVWMAVYPPQHERRVRLHVPDFQVATGEAGHAWAQIDIMGSFERWMADHDYREEYFEAPRLLETALPAFFDYLTLASTPGRFAPTWMSDSLPSFAEPARRGAPSGSRRRLRWRLACVMSELPCRPQALCRG
jgi:hypothetical protein